MADNLRGLAPLDSESGVEQYTPLTLRSWIIEQGPVSCSQACEWGARLLTALAKLHQSELVHRDVKPANVLFFGGKPSLGDYGLVGRPGTEPDFFGTEGFQPLEGTNDQAADLFALGKTLYEAWTGLDRLEFPSLPQSLLETEEWNGVGKHLNRVLLQACHAQPGKRFRSAEEFRDALQNGAAFQRSLNRRRWLATVGACAVVAASVAVVRRWGVPPATAVWKKVRAEGFGVEFWQGSSITTDWATRRMYSVGWDGKRYVFESLGLDNLELDHLDLERKSLPDGIGAMCVTILHPTAGEIWLVAEDSGEVSVMDLKTLQTRRLGGGPSVRNYYGQPLYWNPITNRLGRFGGYGGTAVRNSRHEFEVSEGKWVEIEGNRPGVGPWPRQLRIPFASTPDGKRLLMVGGFGSPSGVQGQRFPRLSAYNGQFHLLDDIWELNLEGNSWRQWLEVGHLDPARLRVALYHPAFEGLVLMLGSSTDQEKPTPAETFLFRPGIDPKPRKLPAEGDVSILTNVDGWTLDPKTNEVILLTSDGIFRVNIQPPGS